MAVVATVATFIGVALTATTLQSASAEVAGADEFLQETNSFDALVRRVSPLELQRRSPYVEQRAFPFVLPAVRELRARFQVVEGVAQSRRLPLRHLFQVIYGSTFLPGNPVANDLDLMLGVHLGRLRLEADKPSLAAEKIVFRIEEYLRVSDRVFAHHGAPGLATYEFSVLENGTLRRRDEVIRHLSASLADVGRGQEQVLLIERGDGLGVPTTLSPRESYIHETTRIQFPSNLVRSVDWMFTVFAACS